MVGVQPRERLRSPSPERWRRVAAPGPLERASLRFAFPGWSPHLGQLPSPEGQQSAGLVWATEQSGTGPGLGPSPWPRRGPEPAHRAPHPCRLLTWERTAVATGLCAGCGRSRRVCVWAASGTRLTGRAQDCPPPLFSWLARGARAFLDFASPCASHRTAPERAVLSGRE